MAKEDLNRLFYRSETTFSFEKYVIKTKKKLNVLDNYNVPLYEKDKVRQLLDNINCPNNDLKTKVIICISIHSDIFRDSFHITINGYITPFTSESYIIRRVFTETSG